MNTQVPKTLFSLRAGGVVYALEGIELLLNQSTNLIDGTGEESDNPDSGQIRYVCHWVFVFRFFRVLLIRCHRLLAETLHFFGAALNLVDLETARLCGVCENVSNCPSKILV